MLSSQGRLAQGLGGTARSTRGYGGDASTVDDANAPFSTPRNVGTAHPDTTRVPIRTTEEWTAGRDVVWIQVRGASDRGPQLSGWAASTVQGLEDALQVTGCCDTDRWPAAL
jgi:hypothetical protein